MNKFIVTIIATYIGYTVALYGPPEFKVLGVVGLILVAGLGGRKLKTGLKRI